MTIDIKKYTENYNAFVKEYKKRTEGWEPKQYKQNLEEIYKLAESHGLKVDRKGTGKIYSPENIKSGSIRICADWEEPYKVPKGNWLYKKEGVCSTGCLCVDKGADKSSLDKINSLKFMNLEQVCDGSKEHKPRINKKPMIAFEYRSKSPLNLGSLRNLCRSAERITINDYGKQDIMNLCKNEILTEEETKASRIGEKKLYRGMKDLEGKLINKKKKYPSVIVKGKQYNNIKFWKDLASVLPTIEGTKIDLNKSPKNIIISKNIKIKKKQMSFDFGY